MWQGRIRRSTHRLFSGLIIFASSKVSECIFQISRRQSVIQHFIATCEVFSCRMRSLACVTFVSSFVDPSWGFSPPPPLRIQFSSFQMISNSGGRGAFSEEEQMQPEPGRGVHTGFTCDDVTERRRLKGSGRVACRCCRFQPTQGQTGSSGDDCKTLFFPSCLFFPSLRSFMSGFPNFLFCCVGGWVSEGLQFLHSTTWVTPLLCS